MKKLVVVALFTGLMMGTGALAEERTFQIDPVHSSVQFRIRHLFSTVVGRFDKFEGTLSGDPANPASLKVSASVDIASVNTANEARDKHLRSADFFDVDHHPKAAFVSTRAAVGDTKDTGTVTGKLTIRGITKEVTFKGNFLGEGADPKGATRAGFHATTTLNRVDFGVAYNATLPGGVSMLGNDVELIIDVEAIEVKAPASAESKPPAKAK